MILIYYTTHYRKGSKQFRVVAQTLYDQYTQSSSSHKENIDVKVIPILTKLDFKTSIASFKDIEKVIFIGHSGMYGIMFGTVTFPEQMSRHEWKDFKINFQKGAQMVFLSCRSARWFAPFLADLYKVEVHGYYWYTTFSKNEKYFRWPFLGRKNKKPLYVAGCPGKKSHGFLGALKKYSGLQKLEKLKKFEPQNRSSYYTYDQVANLYNAAFQDSNIRIDEMNWIKKRSNLDNKIVLDLGCGNGIFLRDHADVIKEGHGVDNSKKMIELANLNISQRVTLKNNISFQSIKGPKLPFQDNQFDTIVSILSFRYLDWDPMISEMLRILKDKGQIIIIDMVAKPLSSHEWLLFLWQKIKKEFLHTKNKKFHKNLSALVNHKEWKRMLNHNPMRAEHEYLWYLKSRFPLCHISNINLGFHSRTLGFDSGCISKSMILENINNQKDMVSDIPKGKKTAH